MLVVVAYNSATDLPSLLNSVDAAARDLTWQAIVVNNSPAEDLTDLLAAFPNVSLLEPGENLGYSGGLNLGVRAAPDCRYFTFLNPDLKLGPGALTTLLHELERSPSATAAVPAIQTMDNHTRTSIRREPSILGSLGEALFGNGWPSRPAVLTEVVRDPADYGYIHAIDWATGAALVVRSEAVATIGDWDALTFFLYSEEVDYSRRIREAGGQVMFVPESVVHHVEGGSGSAPALLALMEVNRVRYYRKWHGPRKTPLYALVVLAHNTLRLHRPGRTLAIKALCSPKVRATLPHASRNRQARQW
ncbi:glycosyltransferase family 2 protein [Ornithinicoccus hortensis]|uniref:glycosyltransferase family 2 protein n=1 Tax=Ornithinicoccus hortensis TaxID=82346 RepID=UPI0014796DB2|nr:glycosyltransferase family 2 protein [Ornithinicoccus hortensis]